MKYLKNSILLTTLLVSVATLASPSALAAGGRPPEEPTVTEEPKVKVTEESGEISKSPTSTEEAPSSDSDCLMGFCPGDAAIINEPGWTAQKVIVQSLERKSIPYSASVKNPTSGDIYQIPIGGLALSWPNRKNIRCDKLGVCIGDKGWRFYSSIEAAPRIITIVGLRINAADAEKNGAYMVEYPDYSKKEPFIQGATGDEIAVPRRNGKASCFRDVCTGDRIQVSLRPYIETEVLGIAIHNRYTWNSDTIVIETKDGFMSTDSYSLLMKRKKSEDEIAKEAEAKDLDEARNEKGFDAGAYQEARRQGLGHRAALDYARGPAFTGFTTVAAFLSQLAQHVYAFDRAYLEEAVQVVRSIENARGPTDLKVYAGAMILPYLRHINYPGLRDRFLSPSVKAMEQSLASQGVQTLNDLDAGRSSRVLALRFLAASLRTSKSVANDRQKSETDLILTALGNVLAANGSSLDGRESQRIEAHVRDLAQNPYLTARAATDMALLEFLRSI